MRSDRLFVRLYAYSLGKKTLPDNLEGIEEAFIQAQRHGILPAVYAAAKDSALFETVHEEIRTAYGKAAVRTTALHIVKTAAFREVYRKLLEAGLCPTVLKGQACAELYPKPEYRISGDEDIAILPEDYPLCEKILCGNGFICKDGEPSLRQSVTFIEPSSGLRLEVHLKLFESMNPVLIRMEALFEGSHSRCVMRNGLSVFSVNDGLLYLVFHFIRHFTDKGVGLRQLSDIMLYLERFRESIDTETLTITLKNIGCFYLFVNIIDSGVRYLGFQNGDIPDLRCDKKPEPEALFDDICDAGVFGNDSRGRIKSQSAANNYMGVKRANAFMASVFPNIEYMKERYLCLRRYPFLLPVTWLLRCGKFLIRALNKKERASLREGISVGDKRRRLFDLYFDRIDINEQ